MFFSEEVYENVVLELFKDMGYSHVYAPNLNRDYKEPFYDNTLCNALTRINPNLPHEAITEAIDKLRNIEHGNTVQKNIIFTKYIQDGVTVKYFKDNETVDYICYLVDYKNIDNNEFHVINQWSFSENSETTKRPDIILFLNGMPVVVIELKSPSSEEATHIEAYRQIKNYIDKIPTLFTYNMICAISDCALSKAGSITANEERFMEWKTKDGIIENNTWGPYKTFFQGMFNKQTLLELIKSFICFTDKSNEKLKLLSAYHQYYGVKKAVTTTLTATKSNGKAGVFWHTQGSGKSISMVFYTKLLMEELNSPTIVVVTDRNDLDDQLFKQFFQCREFLKQEPVQADSRQNLIKLLKNRKANGIIFTTMQKFEETVEPLSDRKDIIVIADEAHRGHYGLLKKITDTGAVSIGNARKIHDSLPNATYIGFTGTPISSKDKDTREVFGDYIDIYDMTQSVEDGATKPVYYESRVIKLRLDQKVLEEIDKQYDEFAEIADEENIEQSKKELAKMEALLGAEETIHSLSADIIEHYEKYRENLLTGKAMIVSYSRSIAIKIYKKILELRPDWAEKVKVVATESNKDPEEWHSIIRDKKYRDEVATQFKDDNSNLKIAIVVDMWLTGFDVPSLATMYFYKHLHGHKLMQAIARVNRVFQDKEGGLIVDYIGMASALKIAMHEYTKRDISNYGDTDITKVAYPKFLEKLSICRLKVDSFNYDEFSKFNDTQRFNSLEEAVDKMLNPHNDETKKSFLKESLLMKQACSLCGSIITESENIEYAFYIAVRTLMLKSIYGSDKKMSLQEINNAINRLLQQSIKSEGIINLITYTQEKFSIFDPNFLEEVSKIKQKNIAIELLKKLLSEHVNIYKRSNLVQSQAFSEKINGVLNSYINSLISSEEVIEELKKIAHEMNSENNRTSELGLTEDEIAFYDALTKPENIKDFYENEVLITMTKELTETLRKSRTIDWQKKEAARANMRSIIKRLLKKYKYPPKETEDALAIIIKQCELWADSEL